MIKNYWARRAKNPNSLPQTRFKLAETGRTSMQKRIEEPKQ